MPRSRPNEDAVRERLRERPVPDREAEQSSPEAGGGSAPRGGAAGGTHSTRAESETASVGPDVPADDAVETDGAGAEDDGSGDGAAETAASGVVEEPVEGEVERQRDEYLALAQRTQADFDNYRKRAAKDVASAGARAKANLARELLPAVDNLERALASAGEDEQSLAEGVRLVHAELVGALGRSGIEAFDPVGHEFDPVHHEALTTRPQEGVQPGVVLDVVEKGYRSGEAVLRPARVVVSA